MKTLILFVLFSGALLFTATAWNRSQVAPDTGIRFTNGSWDEIKAKARKEKKIIFLDVYASWCGPCKMLKRNTFSYIEVGEYFNAHFINVALDGENGEGRLLAKQYGVHGYPTMLFIMPDGSIKNTAVGYHTPKQLLKQAYRVVN